MKNTFKKIFLACFLLFAISLLNQTFAAPVAKKDMDLDKIVAIVNDDVITQSELTEQLDMAKKEFIQNNEQLPEEKEFRSKILDSLINTTLQMQLAERNKIKISDDELNHAIAIIAQNNKLSLEQLSKSLEKDGMNITLLRNQIRKQMTLEKLHQMLFARDINITDEDVKAVLHNPPKPVSNILTYHIIDVLIPLSEKPTSEQLQATINTAQTLQSQLKTTNDAAKLVKGLTVNNQNVTSTDLGLRKLSDMPSLFAREVYKMKVGDVTSPIEAPNGYHLLKLIATQGVAPKPMKLTLDQAKQIVFQNKMAERAEKWIKELRANAYVKIMINDQ